MRVQVHIPGFDVGMTADSGQCFRFYNVDDNTHQLYAKGRQLTIISLGNDQFDFDCSKDAFNAHWFDYFDLARDYAVLGAVDAGEDSYVSKAIRHAKGIRVLKQEPFETLVAFIISQRKSIPAIKTCMEKLAVRFGQLDDTGFYSFPDAKALAMAADEDLAACGLGYRTPYIKQTAQMIARGELDLELFASLPDEELLQQLMRFPGVGKKVASCVMLFAYQRMDAFPVDVWIQRVLETHYPEGFPYERYPGVLGIIQQNLFVYARHEAGRK